MLAIDMGAMPMCAYMHRKGMLIDPKRFEVLSAKLAVLMGEELATCRELLSEPDFNPDSSDQLAEVFFDKLQLHRLVGYKPKRTPSQERYAADNAALQAVKSAHPAVFHTLRFREYSKLKGAFADKLPLMADANGRIHTDILGTRTITDRYASKNPNLQQIPSDVSGDRSDLGPEIRCCFIAPDGYVLGSWDLSAIEYRVVTHITGDKAFLKVFWAKGKLESDPHTQTAVQIFGKKQEDIDKATERYPCKTAGFLILYGGMEDGLQGNLSLAGLDWSKQQCKDFIKQWFRVHPEIEQYIKDTEAFARQHGYVENMFGHRMHIWQCRSTQTKIREEGRRMAQNARVQSSAAHILKLAMARIWEVCRSRWARGDDSFHPIMTVHDEILAEVREGTESEVDKEVKPCFEKACKLSVPLVCGSAFARDWGSVEK